MRQIGLGAVLLCGVLCAGLFVVSGMADDFDRYGVRVDADFILFYFDGVELRRLRTPEEQAKVRLYLLVDLALGGGGPIDKTPNPSFTHVDYVRAYSKGGYVVSSQNAFPTITAASLTTGLYLIPLSVSSAFFFVAPVFDFSTAV